MEISWFGPKISQIGKIPGFCVYLENPGCGPSTDSGPSGESSVAEEELLAMLDSEVAAEALAGGDTPLISEMLAMIG